MKLDRHSIWPLALALAIFAGSSNPSPALPNPGFSYDKIAHFLVFGLLATSVLRIPYFYQRGWKGVLATVVIVSSYGVIDELRQMFTEGRSVDFKDWVADTSGAICASVLYFKWHWYRLTLEKCFSKKQRLSPAKN